MPVEEFLGQSREIFGRFVGQCDLCGAAVPVVDLHEVATGAMATGYEDVTRLCDQCWERIYKGELDVAMLLIEEDERQPDRMAVAW